MKSIQFSFFGRDKEIEFFFPICMSNLRMLWSIDKFSDVNISHFINNLIIRVKVVRDANITVITSTYSYCDMWFWWRNYSLIEQKKNCIKSHWFERWIEIVFPFVSDTDPDPDQIYNRMYQLQFRLSKIEVIILIKMKHRRSIHFSKDNEKISSQVYLTVKWNRTTEVTVNPSGRLCNNQ